MTRPKRSTRIKKTRVNTADMLASQIMPASQAARKDFELCDVANHTDADQRHMQRSGAKQTIRRKTHIQILAARKVITLEQAPILQWYADQHEAGFGTVGCTANYGGAGGGGFGSHDLLARYGEQQIARDNYHFARKAIPPHCRAMFERVVLGALPLARADASGRFQRIGPAFRQAVGHLEDAIGHLVPR